MVDRQGIPLAITLTAANVNECTPLAAVIDAIRPTKQANGRRRKRPRKLHADKGYDYRFCRDLLRQRHIRIRIRIARKGIESSKRLGRPRWVVERTLAWRNRDRRLTVRSERRADIHQAFLTLGCALICWNCLS